MPRRCTEKILNQLEHHTDKIIAQQNRNGYQNRKYGASTNGGEESITSHHLSNNTPNANIQSDEKVASLRKVNYIKSVQSLL